jgi:HEAT repeat protein
MPGELSPASVAANLSCMLYLARHKPSAEEELQEAGRVFLCGLDGRLFSVVATTGWLSINENKLPSSSPGVREVNESLLGHGISRLELAERLELSDTLLLVRTLAAFPGTFSWEELLASLGPVLNRLRLTRAGSDLSVIRFQDVETEMIPVQHRERELIEKLHRKPVVDEGGLILPPMAIEHTPDPVVPQSPAQTDRRAEARRVEQLVAAGRTAVESGDYPELLKVSSEVLGAAEKMSSDAQARMTRLELKRLLSKHHIAQFARMAATGAHREEAIDVLRRLGSDATEILMDLLIETEAMAERRGYFSALTRMEDGTEIIVHHLDHPMWYVVRNAAELCAEMKLVNAVPHLAKQASHPDERVRKSVALALARISTPDALEPISRMLKDVSPQVRLQVLGNLDGGRARALAMPLAALLQTEEHPDVLREVLRVLGRIGTPDALLALRRVAQGEVRRFGKRIRLQAIESLGTVGPAGAQILRSLAGDADSEIGNAAARALQAAKV